LVEAVTDNNSHWPSIASSAVGHHRHYRRETIEIMNINYNNKNINIHDVYA